MGLAEGEKSISPQLPIGLILLTGSCPRPLTRHTSTRMSPWTSTLARETALVPVIGPLLSAQAHPLHPAMPMPLYLVTQLCPTLCNPMGSSPPGSPVHEILQARILEWVAMLSSRGSSGPRDRTQVSHIARRFFII